MTNGLTSAQRTADLTNAINAHMTAHNYHTCFMQATLVAIWFDNYGFDFCPVRFDEMVQEALEDAKADRKAMYHEQYMESERNAQEVAGQIMADAIDFPYEHAAESRGF